MTKKNVYTSTMNVRETKAVTPQTEKIPGREKEQAHNNAGGVSFLVDKWTQLDRFLVLGTESGSYYVGAMKMTKDNAKNVLKCLEADGARTVARIVEISEAGRAPKNDPALFALALALTHGDLDTKSAAADAIPAVARIGTHMFHLAEMVNGMRSWGRPVRRGFDAWYNGKEPMALAHQMVKYANRDGWTHRDVLRKAHVKPISPTHDALFTSAVGKAKAVEIDANVAEFMAAVDEIKTLADNPKKAVRLIEDFKLPREVLPTELLTIPLVWESLLPHMGITALVRNLATMTRVGLFGDFSENTKLVVAKMTNEEQVKKSRIHPLQVLVALNTYSLGHGVRGGNTWTPVRKIVDALDAMFYLSFKNVIPTGKSTLLALDVSGSMGGGEIAGMLGITPRIGSAAMAMITARTESDYEFVGFSTGLRKLNITDKMSLNDVIKVISGLPFDGTDCALPMVWADKNKLKIENFAIYTDNETWAGRNGHPSQALQQYRGNSGIAARLAVVGMTATPFSIADPKDAGMMDVAGFDTAAPGLMADFFRGEL